MVDNVNSYTHEYVYDDKGDLEEVQEVEDDNVEVPDEVEPDVPVEPTVAKTDRRGKISGGSDYVYYGDF